MSILEPTIVEATTNTVTVVVTNNYDTISVVQPQFQSVVVRDSVIRGPEGPQGPSGPAAFEAYAQANAAYAKANAPITVKEVHTSNNAVVNTFSSINTLQFDSDSGMAVVDESSNTVTIKLNSTFKTWNIDGNTGLVAFGLDTVNFISANGIALSANNLSSPKTFKIDAPDLPNKLNVAGGTITGSLNVDQDLSVSGNISVAGNLTIGNQTTDTINVVADFSSNLIPDVTQQFNLGSAEKEWKELHVQTAEVNGNLTVAGTMITHDIIPDANITYDIGTANARFRDLYLSNSSIYLGDAQIFSNGESIVVSSSTGANIEINALSQTVNTTYLNANVLYTGPIATTFNVFTTTSNDPVIVDSFLSSEYTTVKYIIQAKSIEGVHACELFCMHDGVGTYLTEFATLLTSHTLGVYNMNLEAGLVKLIFEPYNPDNNIITIKLVRQAITL